MHKAIRKALDLYHQYLNHRSIQEFMLRQENLKSKRNAHFMPAIISMSGVENKGIKYCEEKTIEVHRYYADRMNQLQEKTMVQHYQLQGTFEK